MKKNHVLLLAACGVCIVLGGAYLGLSKHNSNTEAESESETESAITLSSLTADDLTSVTVENTDGSFTLKKSEDAYTCADDADFPLSESSASSYFDSLGSLTASRALTNASDLSEYGLDSPTATLTLQGDDDSTTTLYLGDENTSASSFYLMDEDKATVYLVDSTTAALFQKKLNDLAELTSFPTISSDSVDSFAVTQGEQTVTLAGNTSDGSDVKTWTVADQDSASAQDADSSIVSTLLTQLNDLTFDELADYKDDDLAAYGLDIPAATIDIHYTETTTQEIASADSTEASLETDETCSDETTTDETSSETETETEPETETIETPKEAVLLIGAQADEDTYYVKLQDETEVHTMSADFIDACLKLDVTGYLNTYVSYLPLTSLDTLEVTLDETTYTLSYTSEEKVVEAETESESENQDAAETESETEPETETVYTYYVNGKEADSDAFNTFYTTAYMMQVQTRDTADADLQGDATFSLKFTQTDGTVTEVNYIPYQGFYVAVCSDGTSGLVSKLNVTEMIDDFKLLIE